MPNSVKLEADMWADSVCEPTYSARRSDDGVTRSWGLSSAVSRAAVNNTSAISWYDRAWQAAKAALPYDRTSQQAHTGLFYALWWAIELRMDLADVLNLDGTTYSPAMLSTGTEQAQTQYAQQIAIMPVAASDLGTQVASAQADAARVAVTVTAYGKSVVVQSYYVFDLSGVPFK